MDRKMRSCLVDAVLVIAVIVALIATTCSRAHAQVGSTDVPVELPRDIKGWEETSSCQRLPPCKLQLANAIVEYDMYTPPERPMLYGVTHYRVRPTRPTALFAPAYGRYPGREAVVWLQFPPGKAVPVARIFVKELRRPWWGLGLVRQYRWEELVVESERWIRERGVYLRVMSVDALIWNHAKNPATLEF